MYALVPVSEYWRMPRVFKYDDYDICLNDNPTIPSVYCVVKAVIRPDNSSEVWGLIERISSKWKIKLNHAHLDRGVCVRDCEMRLQRLSGRLNDSELLVPKFNTSYRVNKITFPYCFPPFECMNLSVDRTTGH